MKPGLTLEQYKEYYLQEEMKQVAKSAGFPEQVLVLTEDEKKIVADLRNDGQVVVTANDFESMDIIKYRAENSPSFISLLDDLEKCKKIINDLKCQAYFVPYFRHVILVRCPTQEEFDDHREKLEIIEEERSKVVPAETIRKRKATKQIFISKMIIFPRVLPTEKLDLLDTIYALILQIASDYQEVQYLKLLVQ